MKVVIDGTTYDGKTIDSLSIKHVLQFNRECAEHGYPVTWQDIERIRAELVAIKDVRERERHPDALMLTAVSIWASRIAAGDEVTFEDVISLPLGRMAFILEPGDVPDESEAADPHRARPGSGRAAEPRRKATAKGSPKRT